LRRGTYLAINEIDNLYSKNIISKEKGSLWVAQGYPFGILSTAIDSQFQGVHKSKAPTSKSFGLELGERGTSSGRGLSEDEFYNFGKTKEFTLREE